MNEKFGKHSISLENRSYLKATAVDDVISFDETLVSLSVGDMILNISGNDLSIKNLSVENGEIAVTGEISAVAYFGNTPKKGFFGRLRG